MNVLQWEAGDLGDLGTSVPLEVPRRIQGGAGEDARGAGDPPTLQQVETVGRGPLEGMVLCDYYYRF